MATGVFDLLHIGHVRMLEEAKSFGDELVVVVAHDETARKRKHNPIHNGEARRALVETLKPVDRAILGHPGDIFEIVKEIRPDVIALGYDQSFTEEDIVNECARRGVTVKVVRLRHHPEDLDATRKVIDRIRERLDRNELYGS